MRPQWFAQCVTFWNETWYNLNPVWYTKTFNSSPYNLADFVQRLTIGHIIYETSHKQLSRNNKSDLFRTHMCFETVHLFACHNDIFERVKSTSSKTK